MNERLQRLVAMSIAMADKHSQKQFGRINYALRSRYTKFFKKRYGVSKYERHQGVQERARRVRQGNAPMEYVKLL